MKSFKKQILLTLLITLLPIVIGLFLWNQLPAMIPSHFNMNNEVDGWMKKEYSVFGLPLFMAVIHLFTIFMIKADPKSQNISSKMFSLILWTIPVISVTLSLSCYGIALGKSFDIGLIVNILIGLLFIGVGNYMPKSKQSYTTGIKIPWTLSSEENWNRTHRLSGWLWMGCGILFLANGFLKSNLILILCLIVMVFVPCVYSYLLYKKGI